MFTGGTDHRLPLDDLQIFQGRSVDDLDLPEEICIF